MTTSKPTVKHRSPYARMFALPGAKAFCASAALARLPMSMMSLGIVLALNHLYDNWTVAGSMSAAYIVAVAAVTPFYARLYDRFGQRRVGRVVLPVQVAVMLVFAFAALARVPIALLFVLAIAMGATQFSFGALVRTRWTYLLERTDNMDLLNTAYALEAAIDEIVFIFGPILAATLATGVHPVSQLFVPTVACAVGGTVFFSLRRSEPPVLHVVETSAVPDDDLALRVARGELDGGDAARLRESRAKSAGLARPARRQTRNVLLYAGILPLMLSFICFNMSFTTFDVSITAKMEHDRLDSFLGLQLAMIAVGSCIGALHFGSREHRGSHWRRLLACLAILTVGFACMRMAMDNYFVLGGVELLAGLVVSPIFATGNLIVRETVPEQSLTEGLSWLTTAGQVGAALGSLLGGIVLDHVDAYAGVMTTWIYTLAAIPFALIGWWVFTSKAKAEVR
ncbi:MFS transporter [Bifidobacterium cuniculi]|uniref:Transporter n=1 Tax=Bifidobacterium cuniculi TaxID=1688 RepID=A0A087B522_9BIFI|nr:MFS transporter [Bifidobacterium cuniculi]KFI66122.1 transporter [Bifidobacterium cuniculi]